MALGLTPFMLLLAIFQLQLSRCCGQDDIAVGTPIANRQRLAAERLVGTLVNTVVMRTTLFGVIDFPALALRVRDTTIAAYAHQEAPFERLVERLVGARDSHRPPLVQVLFNLVVAPIERLDFAGRRIGPVDIERTGAQFELSLSIDLEVFGQLHLEYASDRFSRGSAMQWADAYLHLLGQVLDDSQRPLADYVVDMPTVGIAPSDASSALTPEASIAACAMVDATVMPSAEAVGLEALVLRLASEVLGTPLSNALDNFFDVGGHSLLALRFAHRMQEETGYRPGVLAIAQSSFRALAMAAAADADVRGEDGSEATPRPNSP
jgi:non-ribosomal peptide synthetase component F